MVVLGSTLYNPTMRKQLMVAAAVLFGLSAACSSRIYMTGNTCSGSLAPGASCAFTVYLVPLNIGNKASSQVTVTDKNAFQRTVKILGTEGVY
jgi:hypothetical protein